MEDCIFCRIARGEMEADIVYSDELTLAFRDINPQAPVHILVVPREHIQSLLDLSGDDTELQSALFGAIREVARMEGIDKKGIRILTNVGEEAGQAVKHLHFHVLGGRRMLWPPG